jgi:hypothetical protein
MTTPQTDAEKLAAAEAMVAEGQEAAKAARLPSAVAAAAILAGPEAQALLDLLRPAVAASVDDVPRPVGQAGVEGTKQMLQRVITSLELGLSASALRVTSLQPVEPGAPDAPPPEED